MFTPKSQRSFGGLGGVVRRLDSVTGPKSVCGNWPLWSPVVSRGLSWSPVVVPSNQQPYHICEKINTIVYVSRCS